MKPIFLFLILLYSISLTFGQEYIRIASFNIADFGEPVPSENRDLKAIANILVGNQLDLIALEEIGTQPEAENELKTLIREMNRSASGSSKYYKYYITPLSGDERFAVLYRSPVIKSGDTEWLEPFKNPGKPQAGGKHFLRIPPILDFKAGNFDFKLIIMHLTWGNLQRRSVEYQFINQYLRTPKTGEQDWIFAGDMNRYGKVKKGETENDFDIFLLDGWKSFFRFPLLETVTEPDDMSLLKAPKDEYATTIAENRMMYDQFIISQGTYREFGSNDPRFGINAGIIAFDRMPPYNQIKDHNELKYLISDHRPVWVRFRIDLPDDD